MKAKFLFSLVRFQLTCVICTLGNNLSYEIQVQGRYHATTETKIKLDAKFRINIKMKKLFKLKLVL